MYSLPDDEQVRGLARDIFARPEFNPKSNWLVEKGHNFWDSCLQRWEEWLRGRLENWTGVSPDPELIKMIGNIILVVGVILLTVIILIILWQLKKRFYLRKPYVNADAVPVNKFSLFQKASAAAGIGDYALASAYLFKAVLAQLRQEGYDIPFTYRSTRWIILELERRRYPHLSLLREFCAEFNYICYCIGVPSESRWVSLLRRGEFFLKLEEQL